MRGRAVHERGAPSKLFMLHHLYFGCLCECLDLHERLTNRNFTLSTCREILCKSRILDDELQGAKKVLEL